MKKFVVRSMPFVVSLAFVSCGNNSSVDKTEMKKDSSLIKTINDSLALIKNKKHLDSINKYTSKDPNVIPQPNFKVYLPQQKLKRSEIERIIKEIEQKRKEDKFQIEQVYSPKYQECEIAKYSENGNLILMTMECGDCSPFMSGESFYFKDQKLIAYIDSAVFYGYSPCWSKKECLENGITETYKKKNFKIRSDSYFFVDSLNCVFKRFGSSKGIMYDNDDTLKLAEIFKDANELLDAREPK